MKSTGLSILVFLFIFSCQKHSDKADQIFYNGTIYTVSTPPVVQAVAVKGGKILAKGSMEDLQKFRSDSTMMINLNQKTMMPGFIEGHAHFMGLGYSQLELDLSLAGSFEEIIEMVRAKAALSISGEWITGRGWHQDKWSSYPPMVQGFPVHHALSAASPDNPVYLKHASGHMALANAKAMELASISGNTISPEGGEIIRDSYGQPSGIFNETAQSLISSHIPASEGQRNQQAYELATMECLKYGITSFHDAGAGQQTIEFYKQNIENGRAGVRLYVMLDGSDEELLHDYFTTGPVLGWGSDFLTIRSVKLYSDGALGSRGAWLLEPYNDMPTTVGHSTLDPEKIGSICTRGLQSGFQICTHAIGDRANREVLDQYEKTFAALGINPEAHRFRIEHAQHLHPADMPRFGTKGVLPAMQAIHMSSDRPWAIDRLGEKRIVEGAYVWQDLLKSGAIIVNGSDAPVEPVNPILGFYASTTRKTLDGTPEEGFEPQQRMTREQALRSFTIDAAYGAFEEDIKGSVEVGKYADFVVFDQDIMQINETDLLKTKVIMTIVNGLVVYLKD